MVFPGTLSRGCTRCRKRRVKCDGRRPGCERCEKYKAPCPGYDRPLAVRYYGKPGETLEREEPPGGSTSTFAINEGYKEGGEVGKIIRFKSPVLINPVLRQPQPSLEEESLTFFLHEYCVHPSQGVLRGHLDFLEGMYRNSDRTSCIRPATLAVAYLSLSRHYKSSTLYITAKKYYGAALHSVNRDLSVANRESLKEETLTSLMLLGIIEPMKCLVIPESQVDMTSPVMRLAVVVGHCGDFYRAARQITTSDDPPPIKQIMLVKVLQQALAIAQGLASAEEETMPPQQTTEKRPEGQTIAAFDSQWTACTWCFFSSCMIVFFSMVHKCSILLLGLGPLDPQEKKLAETTAGISDMALKKTIHVFCQALPYVFGEVDARGRPLAQPKRQIAVMYHMVWPLSVAIASMHSTPQQIALCKMRLDMIRDVYGLKLAWYSVGLARDVLGLNEVET
ncbi:unnamed protein product [Fusarium equiseti]|uniref:Zn(2)-C6 fungal-type domain-containing protein n=1 Tax=Fusarium equiseti TaxID=61235 RepID=A0A8J2J4J9_FUSEQ|nr:unnamed protein product [Fusarium equiseti]